MTKERNRILTKNYAIIYCEKGFLICSKYKIDPRQLLIDFKSLDFCVNNIEALIKSIEERSEKYFEDKGLRCYPEGREAVNKLKEIALNNASSYGHFDCK